ncbi:PREDICTED: cholinephosphotransferase 1-like isoform X2 [Amphimedon queenslandica]|uniref:Uncharacterized protein n=1 Tax=Amphimedon queenslandica TaxID=400682 RepID=A0AAN0JA27_AMPQE|nr:PREDICTED: cholinephosphotransferase 1-like isoform X2 [Amphimedon queenslandica]|eukprot:XP_019853581.1 PREDICTED: cholinephosphotransferase 1-like isoform X2 [Amphimedon queenslandica]
MVFFDPGLSPAHLRGLKDHKYTAEGTSITEVYLQPFWRWSVTQLPLWLAPNLITFTGLVINTVTCLAVILSDLNCEGKAPPILYLLSGIGTFVYQTLDGVDGKQARRTGTNNPLGEMFDHGCDTFSTFLLALTGASAGSLHQYPYILIAYVFIMEFLNYAYHWQTYVSGCLYFKKIDCTEAQFCHIGVMVAVFIFGTSVWDYTLPWFGIPLKFILAGSVICSSLMNLASAFYIILSKGVGKNGATVADTSVLSPIIPSGIVLYCSVFYCVYSPSFIMTRHAMLVFAALALPFVKLILLMMVAGMCKTPLPLFDIVLIGPILTVVNILLGVLIPETLLLIVVAIFNLYDVVYYCIVVVRQVCTYLEISCFTIPTIHQTTPTSSVTPTTQSSNNNNNNNNNNN